MPNEFKKVVETLGPELAARLQQRHRDQIARLCGEADPKVVAWRIEVELRQDDAFALLTKLRLTDPSVFARAYKLVASGLDAKTAADEAARGSEPSQDADSPPSDATGPAPKAKRAPKP